MSATGRTQESCTVTIDIHEGGRGEPLVLLHGVGGSWQIWKPVLPLLEKRYRVIAPTLPGHPGGVPLSGAPTAAALADALVEQLRARGIQTAHVVGNSLGGWLAVELARRGFARSVTALSPAGGWNRAEDFRALASNLLLRYRLMPAIYLLFWPLMVSGGVRKGLARDTMERGHQIPTAEFRAMLRAFRGSRLMPGLFANTGPDGGLQPLGDSSVPLCAAWSEHDRILPFAIYGKPFLERLPHAVHLTIRGVGHVPMYDDPAAVVKVIEAGCRRTA